MFIIKPMKMSGAHSATIITFSVLAMPEPNLSLQPTTRVYVHVYESLGQYSHVVNKTQNLFWLRNLFLLCFVHELFCSWSVPEKI